MSTGTTEGNITMTDSAPGSAPAIDTTVTPQDMANAPIVREEGSIGTSGDYTPLFGEVAPSEAELRGEMAETAEKSTSPPAETAITAPPQESKPDSNQEVKDEKPPEAPKDPVKPPPGFVPHQALHEERLMRRELAAEVERLRRENDLLSALPKDAPPDSPSDFKVLTEEEENILMSEDVVAYNKYARDLRKHQDAQSLKVRQEAHEKSVTDTSYRQMAAAVPGLFDEASDINAKLTDFAAQNGIVPEVLSVLTNPKVKLMIPGRATPVLLGPATAAIVDFIHKSYQRSSAPSTDPASLRQSIEAELRTSLTDEITKKVTADITKQLTDKFKTNPSGFRSIGDTPGSGDIPKTGSFSEADFRRMTPEQQRMALGG